jgi:tripartite-type tricarboxylate transporter receptor subunit TctC
VLAQTYPTKPVRVIVPFGAGTGADLSARILAEQLSKTMRQPFIVENRPGAGGAIGNAALLSAPADGYTLLVNASSQTSMPVLQKNLSFDPRRDIIGVAVFGASPMVLVAPKSRGWRSVNDLVSAAKSKPGSISFASAGVGSTTHLSAEKFCLDAGMQAVHVPYKSTTDALADVMTGRVDFLITSLAPTLASIKEGRLVALAMGSKRSPELPNVPTFTEAGLRENETWFALFAPTRTPQDIVTRLHDEVTKAATLPAVRQRLASIGAEPKTMSIEAFNAQLQREFSNNEQLVKKLHLKVD